MENITPAPWYLRTSARTVGIVAGIAAFILGITAIIDLSPGCIFSGVLEMLNGLVLLSLEGPLVVGFLSFLKGLSNFWEGRTLWYKVAFYGILGIIPLFFCWGIRVGLASLGVILTAILYAFMAMGKRGAAEQLPPPMTGQAGYDHMDRSGLVESGRYSGP